jgi:ATP-dependent protease ClpP protease subunit
MNTAIFKNWRTTLGGVVVLTTQIAQQLGYITPDVAQNITALAISVGLVVASDGSFVQTLFSIFQKENQ